MFLLMCTEWGDESQIVTISLAAKHGIFSIIVGGGIANVVCIVLAILLGAVINKYCAEKWINLSSGLLFIGFGLFELIPLL